MTYKDYALCGGYKSLKKMITFSHEWGTDFKFSFILKNIAFFIYFIYELMIKKLFCQYITALVCRSLFHFCKTFGKSSIHFSWILVTIF